MAKTIRYCGVCSECGSESTDLIIAIEVDENDNTIDDPNYFCLACMKKFASGLVPVKNANKRYIWDTRQFRLANEVDNVK